MIVEGLLQVSEQAGDLRNSRENVSKLLFDSYLIRVFLIKLKSSFKHLLKIGEHIHNKKKKTNADTIRIWLSYKI